MKKILLLTIFVCDLFTSYSQAVNGFKKDYAFLQSGNLVADKNFYLLTVIDKTPLLKEILLGDDNLKKIRQEKAALLKAHASDSCSWAVFLVQDFKFSPSDSLQITSRLLDLYANNKPVFDKMIDNHLRPSGYYQKFVHLSNSELFAKAWGQYFVGINYIIDQFGLGKKMRYPTIDSASYNVNSRYYKIALKDMFSYLSEDVDTMTAFYQPSLAIAMQLMDMNDRDEPARHEPMQEKDNKKAFDKIKTTDWAKYKYACIVIPGNGPELFTTPISPINKMHCDIAANRYKKSLAPFIITSGGYCYPFRGPYCEAIEMKKYLMAKFSIPEDAIIIDPHARHTTTNFRNADRLIIRYGMPTDKPSVFVTTQSQTDYVMGMGIYAVPGNRNFDERNRIELGYLPYKNKQRLSDHDILFYPTFESLHMDPYDPLDP